MEQETLSKIYNQKFYNALHRIEQKIPPIWLMRQAGRYHSHYQNLKTKHTFEELCKTPELICETTMGPIQDFDFDAAILFSDILFPLDYLEMGLTFNPGPEFSNPLTEQMLNKEKEQRGRENYHVENFGKPEGNFLNIDTSIDTPEQSLVKIRKAVKL